MVTARKVYNREEIQRQYDVDPGRAKLMLMLMSLRTKIIKGLCRRTLPETATVNWADIQK